MSSDELLRKDQEIEKLNKLLELGYQEMQSLNSVVENREALKKAIYNASQDIILVLDMHGQIIEYNKIFELISNLSENNILGVKIFKVINNGNFYEDLLQIFNFNNVAILDSYLDKISQKKFINNLSIEFDLSINLKKINLSSGLNYVFYIKDITQELAIARELEESRATLISNSKMSALGEMSSGIAHEINTPLAIIQMRADQIVEMLNENNLDIEMLKKASTAIETTVKRIAKIINGLRSFARDGKNDVLVSYSLVNIVEDTFTLCKEKFKNHQVELIFDREKYIEKNEELLVRCRVSESSQVLLNLLNNSYYAIEQFSDKWIQVNLISEADYIAIQVVDSGNGISQEIQEKIMQPFFTTKGVGRGTGLGLSISKGLMQSMNGDLVYNNKIKNTCFEMRFSKNSNQK